MTGRVVGKFSDEFSSLKSIEPHRWSDVVVECWASLFLYRFFANRRAAYYKNDRLATQIF
jgi:hypothetical protein